MAGKYRLSTLGCKVNQYESEQVRELLESFGMSPAAAGERADLAVVNTCAVTCSATAKSRQALRRVSRGDGTPTIAIGCYASADPQAVHAVHGVTHVLGHDQDTLARLRALVAGRHAATNNSTGRPPGPENPDALVQVGLRLTGAGPGTPPENGAAAHLDGRGGRALSTTFISIADGAAEVNSTRTFHTPIRAFAGRTRAFLKIQDGCDAHCTYCIIPRLRGRLQSKPRDAVVAEARQLVAAGHREIVLTGIFLGAYGRPTAIRKRCSSWHSPLADLVDAVARVDGLARLRLSSLEPGDLDDALLEVLARHECCVPHLHLPLQSGSAEILRRMNRQYSVDAFVEMIDRAKRALDRPAITTDVIVGFPGETESSFAETAELVRECGFCKIHAFPFSPRPQTAAARWRADVVGASTVKQRMIRLRDLEAGLAHAYQQSFVGQTTRVLIEGSARSTDSPTLAHGRSDRYFEVYFDAPDRPPGTLTRVRITRVSPGRVHGVACKGPAGP